MQKKIILNYEPVGKEKKKKKNISPTDSSGLNLAQLHMTDK